MNNMSLKLLGGMLKKMTLIKSSKSVFLQNLRTGATVSNGLVHLTNGKQSSDFNPTWLRENCQCPTCFTHATQQRNVLFYEENSRISTVDEDGKSLRVEWKDGHRSEFPLTWLEQKSNPTKSSPKTLWNAEILKKTQVDAVDYKRFMNTEDGLRDLLQNLWSYGFGLVSDVPLGSMELVKRVSFVQETFFGGVWTFTADLARGDTAYTNIALGAHTDNTYLSCPAGVQVFHCIEHDGTGGETLLVDGFYAAEQLRSQDPAAFQILTSSPVLHQYKEPGVHVESVHRILNTDPWDQSLQSIRYNHYDRAPLPPANIAPQQLSAFYSALERLSRLIEDPASEFWIKLRPGTVLFVDNWRVMHGRAAFTGRRTVTGCYLPRDDWLSKARHLDVL